MSRPSPTTFEIDMAAAGLQAGVHPIPKHITSRPEPGAHGGMYDEKKKAEEPPPAPEPPKVEERVSEADHDETKRGKYKVRDVKPSE